MRDTKLQQSNIDDINNMQIDKYSNDNDDGGEKFCQKIVGMQ